MDRDERFRGLILGTAVGDALGYPAEGLSRKRIAKLFGGRWGHRFFLGRGGQHRLDKLICDARIALAQVSKRFTGAGRKREIEFTTGQAEAVFQVAL